MKTYRIRVYRGRRNMGFLTPGDRTSKNPAKAALMTLDEAKAGVVEGRAYYRDRSFYVSDSRR